MGVDAGVRATRTISPNRQLTRPSGPQERLRCRSQIRVALLVKAGWAPPARSTSPLLPRRNRSGPKMGRPCENDHLEGDDHWPAHMDYTPDALVGMEGIEPSRHKGHWDLNPARLPSSATSPKRRPGDRCSLPGLAASGLGPLSRLHHRVCSNPESHACVLHQAA